MDYLVAFIGWGSVFMVIYACGHLCELVALKLRLNEGSFYFWLAGLVCGFVLLGSTDFSETKHLGWVDEHLIVFGDIFSTWWLALLALVGWGSLLWRISRSLSSDFEKIAWGHSLGSGLHCCVMVSQNPVHVCCIKGGQSPPYEVAVVAQQR